MSELFAAVAGFGGGGEDLDGRHARSTGDEGVEERRGHRQAAVEAKSTPNLFLDPKSAEATVTGERPHR